jgi:hypothetical protein
MATKKQKRQEALEKREAFFAEVRASGLEAQRKDRAHRTAATNRSQDDAMQVTSRYRKRGQPR